MTQRHRKEGNCLGESEIPWPLDQLPKSPPAGGLLSPTTAPSSPFAISQSCRLERTRVFSRGSSRAEGSEHGPGGSQRDQLSKGLRNFLVHLSLVLSRLFLSWSSPWSFPGGYPQLKVSLLSRITPTCTPPASLTFRPDSRPERRVSLQEGRQALSLWP